ncbi:MULTISPECIES: ArdC family protein [Brevundimonas]|uniref:Antirestriction protein n=1 Tax=Brevundimonas abyssalis TAR-001 TaxID=1391729 RepID=A0A8E0TSX3_9CAUL|nr:MULTISPECIES: zincin-like metallopeptidase domain-containing protein [Brevundimonas]GAD60669.1 antirestriction protein [Brevundimonas abyssalis TAR-001]
MTRPAPARPDVHARITETIIAQLEAGVRPWTQPWTGGKPVTRPLRHDGTPYSGVNILLLWSQALSRGYGSPTWMTFRQALSLGAHVRRGETGATVVYANQIVRTEADEDGEDSERRIPFLKAYTVFNVEQIEGLPDRYRPSSPEPVNPDARQAEAEQFFARLGADIRHGGSAAFYVPASDHVQMPPFASFRDAGAYYATLGHECVHWTGHGSRLARDFSRATQAYAREELVAELGAAFLCADLGLELEPREDHAAYLGHWLEVLKADKRFLVSAAAHAQRAVAWLHDRQG